VIAGWIARGSLRNRCFTGWATSARNAA